MPNVLYVAAGWAGSTAHERKEGLMAAGWNIIHLDSDQWLRKPIRIWRGLHHRLHTGPLIWQFNKNICCAAENGKPDIVWIEKGIWVSPQTVLFLQRLGAKVIHYSPDPAISFHATPNFLKALPNYDLMFTTKQWEMSLYHKRNVKKLVYSPKATCPSRTRPLHPYPEEIQLYKSDLVFIGHAEAHYINTIRKIIILCPGINLKIWGTWGKAIKKYSELAPYWQGRGAYGDEYAKALTSAKIGLGLLTKLVNETETARTFEIPACGTFLLAERTPSHLALFDEGHEAEFFDSPEEAAEKIKYYLTSEDKRVAVAKAGYRRFIESDYTTHRSMKECAREAEALL